MALDFYSGQLDREQYQRLKPVAEARLAAATTAVSALRAEREPEWRDDRGRAASLFAWGPSRQ